MAILFSLLVLLAALHGCIARDSGVESDVYDSKRDNTGCPVAWEGRCFCSLTYYTKRHFTHKKWQFISNCTNSGFTDPAVLEWTPKETGVLIFTGNYFQTLPANILSTSHSNLEVLDLSNNEIKQIHGQTFQNIKETLRRLLLNNNYLNIQEENKNSSDVFMHLQRLEYLDLKNALSSLAESNFFLSSLRQVFLDSKMSLQTLNLEQNGISKILDDELFCELPLLQNLHLGNNKLSEINFSEKCMARFQYLGLENNNIAIVKQETKDSIEKVYCCLLYTSPSPRDGLLSRMPSSA